MNLINLPLAFAGGLWMPVQMLPKMFQTIAPIVPQYHLGQLALAAVGAAPAGNAVWPHRRARCSRRFCSAPRRGSPGGARTPSA